MSRCNSRHHNFGDTVSVQGLEDSDYAWLTTNPYTDWVGNNKLPVGLRSSKITPHEKWIIESSDGPGTTGPVTHGSVRCCSNQCSMLNTWGADAVGATSRILKQGSMCGHIPGKVVT